MAFTNSNAWITGSKPVRTPQGPELVSQRFTLVVATGDLAANVIGQIGILPAGCVPVDLYMDFTDIDTSTAAMVAQVGIWDGSGASLSTDAADGGAHWAVNTAVATASYQRMTPNVNAISLVQKSNVDRKLGMKITTAPTAAAAGTIGVTLVYRAAE